MTTRPAGVRAVRRRPRPSWWRRARATVRRSDTETPCEVRGCRRHRSLREAVVGCSTRPEPGPRHRQNDRLPVGANGAWHSGAAGTPTSPRGASGSDEPLVVGFDAGRGVHPLVGVRPDGAFTRLGTGAGGGVPGGPLRIGHVRGRRRLTDALGGLPGPGLL